MADINRTGRFALLRQLAERLQARRGEKDKSRAHEIERDAQYAGRVPLHASVFMKALAERVNDGIETLIFDEALTHSPELTRYLPPEKPGSFFQTRVGMLGTGLPGTVGLKAAAPDKRVIGFAGDGGSVSTIQALNTAARHKLGAKFVICNNRSYRILKYNIQDCWANWLQQDRNQFFPEEFDWRIPGFALISLRMDTASKAPVSKRQPRLGPQSTRC
jgi:benzoylformate decarboxylase